MPLGHLTLYSNKDTFSAEIGLVKDLVRLKHCDTAATMQLTLPQVQELQALLDEVMATQKEPFSLSWPKKSEVRKNTK